jgi:hypothetical protein
MVAEPGPDTRIRAMTSGSAVLVDGGGAARTRPRSTVGRGCGRLPAGICAKYTPKLVALGCRDAADCRTKLPFRARGSTTVPEVTTMNLAHRRRRRRTCPGARERR